MSSPTPVELTTGKVLRQSGLNSFMECGYKYKYGLQPNRPRVGGVVRAIGSAYHKALETYYDTDETNRVALMEAAEAEFDAQVAWAVDGFDWTFQPATSRANLEVYDRGMALGQVQRAVVRYFADGHNWPLSDYEVVGTEVSFNEPFPGSEWRRTGTVDLILRRRDDGRLAIIDHKWTKKKWAEFKASPKQSVQATWYLWMLADRFDTPIEDLAFIYDVMDQKGGFQRIRQTRNETHVEKARALAKAAIRAVETDTFAPNPASFLCTENYCDYWAQCPFGAELAQAS